MLIPFSDSKPRNVQRMVIGLDGVCIQTKTTQWWPSLPAVTAATSWYISLDSKKSRPSQLRSMFCVSFPRIGMKCSRQQCESNRCTTLQLAQCHHWPRKEWFEGNGICCGDLFFSLGNGYECFRLFRMTHSPKLNINVNAPAACPQYVACTMHSLSSCHQKPAWYLCRAMELSVL